jgi:L-rhamnose isomerase
MKFLPWLLAISVLIVLMIQAVDFHKATVCRQEAWLKGTELITRSHLSNPKPYEREWHLNCRLHILREQESISWQRLPHLTKHAFNLPLKGEL